jgi:hypothetical protein
VPNAEFEGGDDGRGYGDLHFFGQTSPTQPYTHVPMRTEENGRVHCVFDTQKQKTGKRSNLEDFLRF